MSKSVLVREPLLVFSELSGQVYIVTKYRGVSGKNGAIVADRKYDATESFDAIIKRRTRWKRNQKRLPAAQKEETA